MNTAATPAPHAPAAVATLPRTRPWAAALTGWACGSALALSAGPGWHAAHTGTVLAFLMLPGLLIPPLYLRRLPASRPAAWSVMTRAVVDRLLIPAGWGALAITLTCAQFYGFGLLQAPEMALTPLRHTPLGDLSAWQALPAPLFWTPLIGSLIRLAGGRTLWAGESGVLRLLPLGALGLAALLTGLSLRGQA